MDSRLFGQECEPSVPRKAVGLLHALLRRGEAESLADQYAFLKERRAATTSAKPSESDEEASSIYGKPKHTSHEKPHRDLVDVDSWLGASRGLQWGGAGPSTRWLLEQGGLLSLVTVEWKASRLAQAKAAFAAPGGAALRARWTPVLAPPMGEVGTLERLESSDEHQGPLAPFVRAGIQVFEESKVGPFATVGGTDGDDGEGDEGRTAEGGAEKEVAGRRTAEPKATGAKTIPTRKLERDPTLQRSDGAAAASAAVSDVARNVSTRAAASRAMLQKHQPARPALVDDAELLPPTFVDFAIVGGGARPACLRAAAARLPASGGVLVLEHSNRKAYSKAIDAIPTWWPRYDSGDERQSATVWITCTEQECAYIDKKIPM